MKVMLLLCSIAMLPAAAMAAWQASGDLLPSDPWLRAMAYLGSLGLGGYLVWWLTRVVWPMALDSINKGFDRIVAKLEEIKTSQSTAHRDMFKELREIRDELRKQQEV